MLCDKQIMLGFAMAIVGKVSLQGVDYFVDLTCRSGRNAWKFVRAVGRRREAFKLDHDRRHQRFFLTPEDQDVVGSGGLMALEKLARLVLPRR